MNRVASRNHSEYITTGRFAALTAFGKTDYKAWATGLEQAGYGAQTGLAAALIGVIEQNELTQYDN